MRLVVAMTVLGLAATLAACESGSSSAVAAAADRYLQIESVPTGAQVTFPDESSCVTPCTVEITFDMVITVAKIGYLPRSYNAPAGASGALLVELEEAAPTTDVEESALPDL